MLNDYLDIETIFKPYGNLYSIFFVVGEKNIGKSYSAITYVQKRFIQYGERFLYIRRSALEAEDFIANIPYENTLGKDFTCTKRKIFYKKKGCGDVDYMSGMMSSRSKQNEDFYTILYDECVGETYERDIPKAIEKLYKIISNYARERIRNFKVIMIGNFNNLRNEYLNAGGVEAPKGGGFVLDKENSLCVYFSETSRNFASENKKFENTALAGLNKLHELKQYFVENIANDFLDLYIARSKVNIYGYRYGFVIGSKTYNVIFDDKLQKDVIIEAREKEPALTYYAFDLIEMTSDGVARLPFDVSTKCYSILNQIKYRKLLFTDMSMFTPLLKQIVKFIPLSNLRDLL